MANGNGEAGSRDWDLLIRLLRSRWRGVRPTAAVEDAVQDALLCVLYSERSGHEIRDVLAFLHLVVERRLVDDFRRLRRLRPCFSERLLASPESSSRDWVIALQQSGFTPTANWGRILELIASGVTSSRALAQVLGRDVTSVRESRTRLRRWLEAVRSEVSMEDPPPPTT